MGKSLNKLNGGEEVSSKFDKVSEKVVMIRRFKQNVSNRVLPYKGSFLLYNGF